MSGSYTDLDGEVERRRQLRELARSVELHRPASRPRKAVARGVLSALDESADDLYADRGFVVDQSALVAATAAFWSLGARPAPLAAIPPAPRDRR